MQVQQPMLTAIGRGGCYFLCICKLAAEMGQKPFNLDWIYSTWMDAIHGKNAIRMDGFVNDPVHVFNVYSALSGSAIRVASVQHVAAELKGLHIAKLSLNGGAHFVVRRAESIVYDPYQGSNISKNGKYDGARLFT
jgi:hypothetical protein